MLIRGFEFPHFAHWNNLTTGRFKPMRRTQGMKHKNRNLLWRIQNCSNFGTYSCGIPSSTVRSWWRKNWFSAPWSDAACLVCRFFPFSIYIRAVWSSLSCIRMINCSQVSCLSSRPLWAHILSGLEKEGKGKRRGEETEGGISADGTRCFSAGMHSSALRKLQKEFALGFSFVFQCIDLLLFRWC